MKKINYLYLLALSFCFIQCTKTKLSPIPTYKATSGTKLNSTYLHLAGMYYDDNYTYILDNRYGYHLFFRINETTGVMENIPRFNNLQSFAVTADYIYIARPNVYPNVCCSFYRVNKSNYDDSVLINPRMYYSYLNYVDGTLYGINQLRDLCKIDPLTGNGTEIITSGEASISVVSFTSYINSSQFYNGWWMFINDAGGIKYMLKVKTDGSKQIDTIQSIKTPIFAVHNNRIYFALNNPNYISNLKPVIYKSCLASVAFDGGLVTIEDTTNIRLCNTVSNYGNQLLIGDGRFIKTFDPVTKQVKIVGAMDVLTTDAGYTTPAYPFCNKNNIYYSSYDNTYPVYKLQ